MTWQIAVTLLVTIIVFFGFIRERWPPELTAAGGVSLLLISGILPSEQFLSVFANEAPITIAAMFVLSAALERTGVINLLGRWVVKLAKGAWLRAMLVMVLPVMGLSAFINNTPVVVIFTPVMLALAKQSGIAPSKLLIPLSFMSILGGTSTLLGTSTNLLVAGVAHQHGMPDFGLFEITPLGLCMAGAGLLFLLIAGYWLLPVRQGALSTDQVLKERRFLMDLVVPEDSKFIGHSVAETELGKMDGVKVVDLTRYSRSFRKNMANLPLRAGDQLMVEATADTVAKLRESELINRTEILPLKAMETEETQLVEAVVGPDSHLVGSPVSTMELWHRYGVFVVALHRHKKRLFRNFDELSLQMGDVLLLEGTHDALQRLSQSREFFNVTVPDMKPPREEKAPIAIATLVAVIAVATLSPLPIVTAAIAGATLVVAAGCLKMEDAYEAVQWPILGLIYAMLAIGLTLEHTGAMALIVGGMADWLTALPPIVILGIVYLIASLLTEVMTNNAAAILLTPLAIGLADQAGLDARPLVIAVMFGASASFATPIGYQTNTFVYHAGRYKFVDFVKIGVPLNLIGMIVCTLLIPMFWPLNPG